MGAGTKVIDGEWSVVIMQAVPDVGVGMCTGLWVQQENVLATREGAMVLFGEVQIS